VRSLDLSVRLIIEPVRIALFHEAELSLRMIVHSNSSIEKNQTLFEILYLQDK
jgi:hypothetical protein